MIDKLHNLANAILGIEEIKVTDNLYRFIIVNTSNYIIRIFSRELIVNPIKVKRNDTVEYLLPEGTYYLRVYENKDNTDIKKYYEEIYVSTDMYGTSRTTIL